MSIDPHFFTLSDLARDWAQELRRRSYLSVGSCWLKDMLTEMYRSATRTFAIEERIMIRLGDTDRAAHLEHHQVLARLLLTLQSDAMAHRPIALATAADEIEAWSSHHGQKFDRGLDRKLVSQPILAVATMAKRSVGR